MTNGENLKNIYPDLEIIREVKDVYVIMLETHNVCSPKLEVFKSWWNAEYKEPSSSGKSNKSEIPTGSNTKNDLGVDNQNIRLIDANALIKRLRPKHFDWWGEGEQDDFGKGNNSMLEEVIEAIEEFPSVTPIRPKGHWIDHSDEGYVECPKCGSATNCDDNITALHFCFSCGAEMRGEEI